MVIIAKDDVSNCWWYLSFGHQLAAANHVARRVISHVLLDRHLIRQIITAGKISKGNFERHEACHRRRTNLLKRVSFGFKNFEPVKARIKIPLRQLC